MKNNGINIKVIETNKFKTICIAVLIKQSISKEYVTYNSLLSKILTMGCDKYKSIKDINIKTESMYGTYIYSDILKKGDNQIIEILIEFIENKVHLEDIFLFLKEIILNPLVENGCFKEEYFNKAKDIVKENILARKNDKKEFAKDRCIELMCKNEKFSILPDGYIEDLEKIDNQKLYKHYKKILKSAQIDIFVIGNVKENDVKMFTEKYFNIERDYIKEDFNFVYKEKTKENICTEKYDVLQGKLCMAYRTNIEPNNKMFIPLLVGNEILGGGSGSKLFNDIREKESLCYYINSFIYIFKGIIFIESGIEKRDYNKAINRIKQIVENMIKGEFNNSEIEIAKRNLCKKYKIIEDYNNAIIDYYYTNYLANIHIDIDKVIEKINIIQKENIQKAFENIYLDMCYFMEGE